jgi:t-SNARE complex subunit (syntaxin)
LSEELRHSRILGIMGLLITIIIIVIVVVVVLGFLRGRR